MDLFTMLEALFRGVVHFFYNLVETIYVLLRHPRRGPARLYRRYKRHATQQLGGLTLLFTLLFILFAGAAVADSTVDVRTTFTAPLDVSGPFAWATLLCALLSTVALDASARLLLRFRFPERRQKREIAITLFEYALAWPMVVLAYWYVGIFFLQQAEDLPVTLLTLTTFIAGIFSFLPAARILFITHRPRKRWGRAARALQISGLFCLFALSLTTADELRYALDRVRNERQPLFADSRCRILGDRLYLDVAIRNPTDDTIAVYVRTNWVLAIQPSHDSPRAEARTYQLVRADDSEDLPLVLEGRSTKVVRLSTVGPAVWKAGEVCRLMGRVTSPDLKSYWSPLETGNEALEPVNWPKDDGADAF
jgi:hypothetical protein